MILAHHLLLDYALICTHFWRFFGWVWLWSLCVQQFWACKLTVSLCLLLLVQRRDERRVGWHFGVTLWRSLCQSLIGWYFGHLVAKCDYIEFDYMEMETELMYILIVEWGVGLADDQTAACRSVSPYRRLLQSAILHTKELCYIYISQRSVIDGSSSVVWSFVLFELEFSSSSCWKLCFVRRA